MRLVASLLGMAALIFALPVLAQEESPAAAAPEEKASTTVQETAAPSPSGTPETKAAATSAEKPAAKKKEEAAAAPQKAASPAAAKPAKKMSVEAALKDNENRWEASFGAHDVSVTQSLVANDFVGVYWDGKVMGKSSIISQIKKDKDTYKSAANEKAAVHTYGPGVAVVVGTAREKGTAKDGKPFDRTFRYTDTWVERNGQWQCVASHVMKIKG